MEDIHQLVRDHKELIINTRRDLHRIPEIGYTEEKTSAYVADYLRREELKVQTEIARFGVVGLLETGKPGPNPLMYELAQIN
jgi:amidohydrolase